MNRRGFLGAILAAGVAPFVVRAESLMAVRVPVSGLILPEVEWLDIEIKKYGELYKYSEKIIYEDSDTQNIVYRRIEPYGVLVTRNSPHALVSLG